MNKLFENKRILVAYYSHSGNTKNIAEKISKYLNSDIFEIKTLDVYTNVYSQLVKQASKELKDDYLPELRGNIDINNYDIIFLGYPNWRNTFPMGVKTFLLNNDFTNKIIIPFGTHEGTRLGKSESDIRKYCPDSIVKNGISFYGSEVFNVNTELTNWIDNLK